MKSVGGGRFWGISLEIADAFYYNLSSYSFDTLFKWTWNMLRHMNIRAQAFSPNSKTIYYIMDFDMMINQRHPETERTNEIQWQTYVIKMSIKLIIITDKIKCFIILLDIFRIEWLGKLQTATQDTRHIEELNPIWDNGIGRLLVTELTSVQEISKSIYIHHYV